MTNPNPIIPFLEAIANEDPNNPTPRSNLTSDRILNVLAGYLTYQALDAAQRHQTYHHREVDHVWQDALVTLAEMWKEFDSTPPPPVPAFTEPLPLEPTTADLLMTTVAICISRAAVIIQQMPQPPHPDPRVN